MEGKAGEKTRRMVVIEGGGCAKEEECGEGQEQQERCTEEYNQKDVNDYIEMSRPA